MSRFFISACLWLTMIGFSAGWVQHPVRSACPGVNTQVASARQVARPCTGKLVKEPAPSLGNAYFLAGVVTIAAWVTCAIVALSPHPLKLPLQRHNAFVIAQALTPIPLGVSVFKSLSRSASKEGWWAMNRMTYRRLNLGVVTVSLWLAAAAFFGPYFSTGYKIYSARFAYSVTGAHVATALFCLGVWLRSVQSSPPPIAGHYLPRLVRGTLGSIWALVPQTSETSTISKNGSASHLDDPESPAGGDGRNEYSIACVLFLWFAMMPNLVGFPLATVPTFLGERLSRAASAWTFLSAVAAYVLKDATQRGRVHSGSTFRYLRLGLIGSCGAHLLLVALKIAGIDGAGTLPCPKASIVSLAMHALAVFAAMTPPPNPKAQKPKSGSAVASTVAVSAATPAPNTTAAATAAQPSAASVSKWKPKMDEKVIYLGKSATIRYVGSTDFSAGEWVGLEMDSEGGKHNGMVFGRRYFVCAEGRGLFTSLDQLLAEGAPVGA